MIFLYHVVFPFIINNPLTFGNPTAPIFSKYTHCARFGCLELLPRVRSSGGIEFNYPFPRLNSLHTKYHISSLNAHALRLGIQVCQICLYNLSVKRTNGSLKSYNKKKLQCNNWNTRSMKESRALNKIKRWKNKCFGPWVNQFSTSTKQQRRQKSDVTQE